MSDHTDTKKYVYIVRNVEQGYSECVCKTLDDAKVYFWNNRVLGFFYNEMTGKACNQDVFPEFVKHCGEGEPTTEEHWKYIFSYFEDWDIEKVEYLDD